MYVCMYVCIYIYTYIYIYIYIYIYVYIHEWVCVYIYGVFLFLLQDQMVLAMLRLMDTLLLQQGLDLALTPYRVLATGASLSIESFKIGPTRVSTYYC